MSSTQRPGRRTSQTVFGDDDAPPAKRTKMDDATNGKPKPANARKGVGAGKNSKAAAYEEEEDGFQFSRAKPKTTTSKQITPLPQVLEQQPTGDAPGTQAPAPAKRGRPKKATTKAAQVETSRAGSPEKRRRSARLSAGQDEPHQGVENAQQLAETRTTEERPISGIPRSPSIRIEKKRGAPTKIALPFADTPVIQRNKEMRKISDGRRRSSSGMRGRRASSLIDSGTSNAMPHSEVETADFYKHIHQDLPEPRRMKQLLVWCGTRALSPRRKDTGEDMTAVLSARTIQEELLRDFANRNEMSDWFNRQDTAPIALVKKPNPRNLQNAAKLLELQEEVKRLKAETATWQRVLGSLSTSTAAAEQPEVDLDPSQVPPSKDIDPKLLSDSRQTAILSDLQSNDGQLEASRSRLKAAIDPFEYKMDTFADGVHKLEKFRESADATVDSILSRAVDLLEGKDHASSVSAGTEKIGIGDLLRSFSRAA